MAITKQKQNALVRPHKLRENRPDHNSGNLCQGTRGQPSIQQVLPSVKFLGFSWGCKIFTTRGREVVFHAWMLEETKPLKQRETLAVRSRIYIYSKTGKVQQNRDKDLLTEPLKKTFSLG
jgi:hypothetical protein